MSGVKGQKWKTERQPRKVQANTSIKPHLMERVVSIASDNRWTVSSTIEHIIEEYFRGV